MDKSYNINLEEASKSLLLKRKQITKYFELMDEFNSNDFSITAAFKTKFNGFYRIRQRSKDFYSLYYDYLIKNKNNKNLKYRDVLFYFYNNLGRIEKSFASKLLATINPNMPVWDKVVLAKIGKKEPSFYSKGKFEEIVNLYEEITDWYEAYLKKENTKQAIALFDNVFPNNNITAIKKVDLILWSIR